MHRSVEPSGGSKTTELDTPFLDVTTEMFSFTTEEAMLREFIGIRNLGTSITLVVCAFRMMLKLFDLT